MLKNELTEQNVNEVDFFIVDVETTGLSPQNGDRICEVGAVKLRGGAIIETFQSLVNPERLISLGAYSVNRISQEMLINAPTFNKIADKILKMLDGSVVVAYNATFDIGFLNSEFRLIGIPTIKNYVVDALAIARQLLPGINKYKQENVARALGISLTKHRALEDAMATAKIFSFFLTMMKAYDLSKLKDIICTDLTKALYSKRLDIVKKSIEDKRKLWVKYLSASQGVITEHIITPLKILNINPFNKEGDKVKAYCCQSSAIYDFQLTRMLDLKIL